MDPKANLAKDLREDKEAARAISRVQEVVDWEERLKAARRTIIHPSEKRSQDTSTTSVPLDPSSKKRRHDTCRDEDPVPTDTPRSKDLVILQAPTDVTDTAQPSDNTTADAQHPHDTTITPPLFSCTLSPTKTQKTNTIRSKVTFNSTDIRYRDPAKNKDKQMYSITDRLMNRTKVATLAASKTPSGRAQTQGCSTARTKTSSGAKKGNPQCTRSGPKTHQTLIAQLWTKGTVSALHNTIFSSNNSMVKGKGSNVLSKK